MMLGNKNEFLGHILGVILKWLKSLSINMFETKTCCFLRLKLI